MKKFGLGKKDKSSETSNEDPSRSRLFGKSRSKADSPAPASTNPYAVPQGTSSPDPYAQPASSSSYGGLVPAPSNGGAYGGTSSYGGSRNPSMISQQPPPYTGGYSADRTRNDKSPVPSGGYGGARNGNAGYGGQAGYGSNLYGEQSAGSGTASIASSKPGGYGGMGRSYSQETLETDAGRDALFGGAKQRVEQKQAQNPGLPPEEDPAKGGGANGNGWSDTGYGAYQERELTAEEQEEEDVQATKSQIRMIKQQDVSSTRNALRIAEQAEATGRETLERLGAQGERIHNTEKNLDLAANQNKAAEEKARELKHLNRSMWAMHVGNPFTKTKRENEREEAILDQHQSERSEREATRAAAYQSSARREEHGRSLRDAPTGVQKKGSLAERSKYQFEADSEDEQMEDEIDQNLDALGGAAKRLNQLGRAMGQEVDSQNEHIGRIVGKADRVDDQIALNRGRLDRIERRG